MTEKKITFREIIAHEKSVMNPIRYHMNYRVAPAYAVFMLLIVGLSCVLMAIDDVYFLPHFIVLCVLFILGSVALVIYGRTVFKREIQDEIQRYDLDYSHIPDCTEFDYSNEDTRILFVERGMYIDDTFYWYNHLRIRILTRMYLHRVIISVGFLTKENDLCGIPLEAKSMKLLNQFSIQLENPEALERILNDTQAAFETIYKKGSLDNRFV